MSKPTIRSSAGHHILRVEGLGEECVKTTLFVSCLEWITCILLFIMVEFEKLLTKYGTTFLVTKVFHKGAMFK